MRLKFVATFLVSSAIVAGPATSIVVADSGYADAGGSTPATQVGAQAKNTDKDNSPPPASKAADAHAAATNNSAIGVVPPASTKPAPPDKPVQVAPPPPAPVQVAPPPPPAPVEARPEPPAPAPVTITIVRPDPTTPPAPSLVDTTVSTVAVAQDAPVTSVASSTLPSSAAAAASAAVAQSPSVSVGDAPQRPVVVAPGDADGRESHAPSTTAPAPSVDQTSLEHVAAPSAPAVVDRPVVDPAPAVVPVAVVDPAVVDPSPSVAVAPAAAPEPHASIQQASQTASVAPPTSTSARRASDSGAPARGARPQAVAPVIRQEVTSAAVTDVDAEVAPAEVTPISADADTELPASDNSSVQTDMQVLALGDLNQSAASTDNRIEVAGVQSGPGADRAQASLTNASGVRSAEESQQNAGDESQALASAGAPDAAVAQEVDSSVVAAVATSADVSASDNTSATTSPADLDAAQAGSSRPLDVLHLRVDRVSQPAALDPPADSSPTMSSLIPHTDAAATSAALRIALFGGLVLLVLGMRFARTRLTRRPARAS